MNLGSISCFLADDHARLDRLFSLATQKGEIALDIYGEFRRGLLRHIGIEEKIVFPALRSAFVNTAIDAHLSQLRRDHGLLAALLVRAPTRETADRIEAIMGPHNALEEKDVYPLGDLLPVDTLKSLLDAVRDAPEVPVAPYYEGPIRSKRIV